MPYIVTVPKEKLDLTDDRGQVVRSENYFWFIVKLILNTHAQQLKGLDLLDFGPVWKIIKAQNGQKTLAIKDERDYKKIKDLVEQNNRWVGQDATDFGIAVVEAFQKAERVDDKEEKVKSKDK